MIMNNTSVDTTSSGVRRGAWTEEEDFLLRKCVENYGEGKWHLVSIRAGLNRCRKSCRMRWLNYLRPHIKRGDFDSDEIDLIMRLHKLLRNRWSLIAGRLSGRTANDVKNYWNTHIRKKSNTIIPPPDNKKINNNSKAIKITKNEIIRPQPRKFSSTKKNNTSSYNCNVKSIINYKGFEEKVIIEKPIVITETSMTEEDNENAQWWASLLLVANCNEEFAIESTSSMVQNLLNDEDILLPEISKECSGSDENKIGWSDLFVDVDLWGLLN